MERPSSNTSPNESPAPRFLSVGTHPSVAVVGAGVAGLTCASRLVYEGFRVQVFDRARQPGGRISTRSTGAWAFDHGAQYFTAKDPSFEKQLETWLVEGAVAVWDGAIRVLAGGRIVRADTLRVRYVGVPGMSALARWLAAACQVKTGVRVADLKRRGRQWCLVQEGGGELGCYDLAVVAVPAPPAALLLSGAPELAAQAALVRMLPTWVLMLGFRAPLELPFDGAFIHGSPVSWIARNASKPGRSEAECWVVHGSHRWSEEHLEDPPERVASLLFEAFAEASGHQMPRPVFSTAHRWRFATPEVPLSVRCLFDEDRALGACGDWCGGARVEGAFLSGLELARRIAESHGGAGAVSL